MKTIAILALLAIVAGCGQKSEVSTTTDSSTVALPPTNVVVPPTSPPGTTTVTHDTVVMAPTQLPTPDSLIRSGTEAHNIRVEFPRAGQTVAGPVFHVRGQSRTFENALSYRLLNASGSEIASGHATSKGSMGQFGPFDITLNTNGYTGLATVEVFDNSPKDGSEIDKVGVPIRIQSGSSDTSRSSHK